MKAVLFAGECESIMVENFHGGGPVGPLWVFRCEVDFLNALDKLPEWWVYKGYSWDTCIRVMEQSGCVGWWHLMNSVARSAK